MDLNQILIKLFFSLMVGAMIGLERENNKISRSINGGIGIRTDIMLSLFGSISILLSQLFSPLVFILSFTSILLVGAISLTIDKFYKKDENNLKTVLSSIIAFLLGALTMLGQLQVSIIIAIMVTFILSLRNTLQKTIAKISYNEIIDGVKFLVIAFVILPFLPNQSFDQQVMEYIIPAKTQQEIQVTTPPTSTINVANSTITKASDTPELTLKGSDILNPYRIWFLIVIISGLDFMGYILVKLLGKNKGYGLTGMIGGFYSSTVTSLTLSQISKKEQKIKFPFVAGILLACGTSFFKMFILVRALNGELFNKIFPFMGIMFAYLIISGGFFHWYGQKNQTASTAKLQKTQTMELKSPLHLGSAIKITTIVVLTMIIGNFILQYTNLNYYYILAALMAFLSADDPIIISTAGIAGSVISFSIASKIVIGVIFLNTLQKVATMYFFGNRKLVKYLAISMFGLFLVTGLAFLYL